MTSSDRAADGGILSRRLASAVELRPDERAAIDAIAERRVSCADARRDVIVQGERPQGNILILSGWACRYKVLEDGRRQITSFMLPGDICDLHNMLLARMDHSIGAISAVRYVEVPAPVLQRLSIDHPRIGRLLLRQTLVNLAMQREWTANIGQRRADERIGSLLCELFLRLSAVGMVQGTSFDFPLTQADIAEASGLTPVHVNRMVQQMRASGLIGWANKVLTIPDIAKLRSASLFDAGYLHLGECVDLDDRPADAGTAT